MRQRPDVARASQFGLDAEPSTSASGPEGAQSHVKGAMSLQSVMAFLCFCLQNPHSYVRSAAISVYQSLAASAGEAAEKYLRTLRPAVIQMLRGGGGAEVHVPGLARF